MTYPGVLLKSSNLFAKKELGQNFLCNPKAAEKIVSLAKISDDDVVLEIGAGLGAITVHAAKKGLKIYAVEKDSRIIPLLCSELESAGVDNVELIQKDILKLNINEIDRGVKGKIVVIGNLPYNISSQVLFRLVQNRALISKAVLMFQKELADRISAPPGGRDYGRLSAVMQYCSKIKTLTDVGSNLFFPKPDVESRVIEVEFVDFDYNLSLDQEEFLFQVIKAAFSKRRKTLRNSLASSELKIGKSEIEDGLEVAKIDPERRAETLGVKEFVALTLALWDR
ncbi:MAG: ribosomal RNA small subunit methyltransferase A [Desulfamplus sp.]|nr:ribosomal RNA small subunit methyltransferase A [Desulfamplus sp.]MBF0390540.1 ribosomal RNA small subunit methyltransferase A [Desulfamplus sp.]